MDIARPYTAVTPTVEGDVLAVLAGSGIPLTGREVVRLVGRRSPSAVASSLDRLVKHGLVRRQQAGRAYLHTLNREHLAAGAVLSLAAMREELRERLRRQLDEWQQRVVHLSMFGSAARGDGDLSSDVDLFLVRPHHVDVDDPLWRSQVSNLAGAIEDWTGNSAEIHELGDEELPGFVRQSPPVLAELRADAVDISGMRLYELLRSAGG